MMTAFSFKTVIVEDDLAIAQLLKIHLSDLGLQVDVFNDAESAYLSVQTQKYDLALLDWMLPGIQGIDLLKKIRQSQSMIKVLMLTAKADADSLVTAIEAGADDYLTKPFDEKVLLARVRNLLRRIEFEKNLQKENSNSSGKSNAADVGSEAASEQMSSDGLSIHFSKYTVTYKNENVHLTPSEFKLLGSLFKAQGKVLTRDQLIGLIQGDDVNVTGRTIDTHIFALRKKLGPWADHIETIRGVGYRVLVSITDRSSGSDIIEG